MSQREDAGQSSPRRMLVIGTSSSAGVGLGDPETEAWPRLAKAGLERRGEPVELVHRDFYAHTPGALAFLERVLAEHPADYVILQATASQLTRRMATNRVRRRFGERAAKLADASSSGLHALAGRGGRPGLAAWRGSVRLARRAIGAEALAEYGPLTDSYAAAIARLARLEAVTTVVIGTGQPRAAVVWTNPAAPEIVRRFNAKLAAAAAGHHIPWIDHDRASPPEQEFEATFVDLFHKDTAWHRGMAEAVLNAIRPSAAEKPRPARCP